MYYDVVFFNKIICGLVIITDFLFKVCLFRHFLRFLGRRYLGISLKNRPILILQRCKIIRNSKNYCFLFAFYFDWHYNKDIQTEVINALDRGVSIYINLSEVSENNICYIHPNLHIRQSQLYKEGDDPVFDAIVKLATNQSYQHIGM